MAAKIIKMSLTMKVELKAGEVHLVTPGMLDTLRTVHVCPCFTHTDLNAVSGLSSDALQARLRALAVIGAIEGCGIVPRPEGQKGRGKTKWRSTEFGADLLGNYDRAIENTKDYIFDGN